MSAVLAAVLCTLGCSKKEPPPTKSYAAAPPPQVRPPAPAVAAPAPVAPTSEATAPTGADPLAEFNRAFQKWASANELVPRDLDALRSMALTAPGLPPLPAPPPGKRLVYTYDKKTMDSRTVRLGFE